MINIKNLQNTKTLDNIYKAFITESQSHVKYKFYADQAKKDGFIQIGNIIDKIAHQEYEHAKFWFKILHNNQIPRTSCNLNDMIKNEDYEWRHMYEEFSNTAREEGFDELAELFENIEDIELNHCDLIDEILYNIEQNNVYHKKDKIIWECENCGYTEFTTDAPIKCPVCKHPKAYFKKQINYW